MHFQIVDEFDQPVVPGTHGELLIDGIQRFPGYFNQDDLTKKVFCDSFYRTNDLVRLGANGLLYYLGRKDYQVKLRGQRIELAEIERCILDSSLHVSACVVTKWNENYLIAYIQSCNITEEQLREHCRSFLPSFMVPSIFIVLEQFPLNNNGKVDRKRLPMPDFHRLTSVVATKMHLPRDLTEEQVHRLWCDFFTIGGHSLLFIQLYHRYQSSFAFDSQTLSITPFLQQMTIANHALLLKSIKSNQANLIIWQSLHIHEGNHCFFFIYYIYMMLKFSGPASFAQQRIILDEQIRFKNNVAVYNELIVFRICKGRLLLTRLQRAFTSVLTKHKVLRTSIVFNDNDGTFIQRIINNQFLLTCSDQQIFSNENQLNDLVYRIGTSATLFDLSVGRVIHAEALRQCIPNRSYRTGEVNPFDVIVIGFHHAIYDRTSQQIFFNDLSAAYDHDEPFPIDDNALQYIDYATHEHELDMSTSRDFWRQQLDGYDFERRLTLPFDRQRLPVEQRSGQASVIEFTFDDHLSHSFINYASAHQLTLFQLGLATFFAFLFKLTNGETDLCIAGINANRYRTELQDLIGMFVATLPYRTQLDPHASFEQLTKQVREQCLLILEHSHYPLQHILADAHYQQSNIAFLETVFDFITLTPDMNRLTLGEAELETVSIPSKYNVAKFDFMLTMLYDPTADNNSISCSLICSSDVFHQNTVDIIGKRFSTIFTQLFDPMQLSIINKPLYKLSILLPDELRIVQELNYIDNNQQMKEIQTINELFCQQVLSHPQKVAVELDEQCLTYNELLFIVQRLSVYLLNEFDLKPGEIVCQCIERSISMVSSSMNIFLYEVTISVRLFSLLIR